jgi:hypothetical protein
VFVKKKSVNIWRYLQSFVKLEKNLLCSFFVFIQGNSILQEFCCYNLHLLLPEYWVLALHGYRLREISMDLRTGHAEPSIIGREEKKAFILRKKFVHNFQNTALLAILMGIPLGINSGCTNEPKISKPQNSNTSEDQNSEDFTEELQKDTQVIKKEKNSSKTSSSLSKSPWEEASKAKTPEEIAEADKKSQDMINAGVAAGDTQGAELKYPKLFYRGVGTYSCEGDVNPSTAKVISQLNLDNLESQLDDARAEHPRQIVRDRINGDLQTSLDSSVYQRLTPEEREDWKKKGYDLADGFAIFALGARKPKAGQVYDFDKPLPVAFWPAALSRYDDLITKGPRTWTAKVIGTKSFTATVKLSHVATEGDKIVLKLETTIPEDKDRSIYEVFPIPKEAVYTINTSLKHVESSKNTNWFFGDNCNENPEQILMTYKLCRKEIGGRYEDFPCQ